MALLLKIGLQEYLSLAATWEFANYSLVSWHCCLQYGQHIRFYNPNLLFLRQLRYELSSPMFSQLFIMMIILIICRLKMRFLSILILGFAMMLFMEVGAKPAANPEETAVVGEKVRYLFLRFKTCSAELNQYHFTTLQYAQYICRVISYKQLMSIILISRFRMNVPQAHIKLG